MIDELCHPWHWFNVAKRMSCKIVLALVGLFTLYLQWNDKSIYFVIMRFILLVKFIFFSFQNKYMCETFVSFRFRHTTNVRANYFSLWKDWGNWIHPRRRAPKRYKKCSYNISYNRRSWRVRIVWIITLFVYHSF